MLLMFSFCEIINVYTVTAIILNKDIDFNFFYIYLLLQKATLML